MVSITVGFPRNSLTRAVHGAARWGLGLALVLSVGSCSLVEPSAGREMYRLESVWGQPLPAVQGTSRLARTGVGIITVQSWAIDGELALYSRGTFRWTIHREVRYEDEPEPIRATQQFAGLYQRTDSTITLIYNEPSWGPRAPEFVVTNNGRTLSGVQGVAEARAAYQWVLKE